MGLGGQIVLWWQNLFGGNTPIPQTGGTWTVPGIGSTTQTGCACNILTWQVSSAPPTYVVPSAAVTWNADNSGIEWQANSQPTTWSAET